MPQAPARRTQAERSASTKAKLVEATIDCLVERGYAGTTTLAVCERAGVSHGSLLHHFGRRETLMEAVLGIAYERLQSRVVSGFQALPAGEPRVSAMVDLMWSAFGAREFKAVLELWLTAANTPRPAWAERPEARALDAGQVELAEALFPDFAERVPDFPVYVSLLVQTLQGMGLAQATLPESSEAALRRGQVRALLSRILREAFTGAR